MVTALGSGLRAANRIALWIAALGILVIAIMGGLDVISTTLFRQPVPTTLEVTEAMMVFIVYLGLAMVHQRRAHIAVDLFRSRMSPGMQRAIDVLSLLLMFAFFAMLAWRGLIAAHHSWRVGEYAAASLPLPIYPARFALAIGLILAALNCIYELVFGPLEPQHDIDAEDRESTR